MVPVRSRVSAFVLLIIIYEGAVKSALNESELYPRTFSALRQLLQNESFSYPELDDETLKRTELLLSDVDRLIEKCGKCRYKVRERNYTPKPPSGTDRRKVYYKHYLRLLGQNDEEKMKQLRAFRFGIGQHNMCYMKAYETFLTHCYYAYYERGGLKPMRNLIANACDAQWLSLDKINDVLQRTCQWKFQYILQK